MFLSPEEYIVIDELIREAGENEGPNPISEAFCVTGSLHN